MKITSGYFESHDRNRMYYQLHLPEGAPRAVLVVVHGMGEHIGRYAPMIEGLAAAGLAAFAYDQRGHGQSAGGRGHIDSWEDYRGDMKAALGQIEARLPDLPVIFYGHSMGALVILDYLLEEPDSARGAILSGVPIEPVGVGTPAQIAMAKILSRLWPTFLIKVKPGFSSKLSQDPQVVRDYDTDPLVFHAVTARWGAESLKTVERIKAKPQAIQLPVLILHGDCDPVNTPQGARAYFEQIGSPDKRWVIYPGCLHEPHNEQFLRDRVVKDMIGWVGEVLEKEAVEVSR